MSLKNIALIGLGEIGSRHLQALSKNLSKCELHCVDPVKESIKLCKSRLPKLNKLESSRLNFYDSLDLLPKHFNLMIIATGADVRFAILQELAKSFSVENLLLEKVLFQKLSHLHSAQEILDKNKINAWVNCSRRYWSIYYEVRKLLYGRKDVRFSVSGGNWGLACNTIHYLDIFGWISGSALENIDGKNLEKDTLDSKRKGFIEFVGRIEVSFSNNNKMSLTSSRGVGDLLVKIEGKDLEIVINESTGDFQANIDGNKDSKKFPIPFQSELTNIIADQVLEGNEVSLPSYTDSSIQHHHLLEAFICHLEKTKKEKFEHCPIT